MGGLVAAQQRQVEEYDQRLADDDGCATGGAAYGRRGGGIDFGVDAARLDVARGRAPIRQRRASCPSRDRRG